MYLPRPNELRKSGYEGYLKAYMKENLGEAQLANLELDCDQSGWGLTPIIGVDAKLGRWNLAANMNSRQT